MTPIKPEKLKAGDMIGIVAPASRPTHPSALNQGVRSIENLGFRVKVAPHVLDRHGFLAGTDQDRLSDFHGMFTDSEVHGIICVRGGYGAARLLPDIDFDIIRNHPKVFVGYSDITALINAVYQNTGLVTFWGPMVASEMSPVFDPYNRSSFLKAISQTDPVGLIEHPSDMPSIEILSSGKKSGRLIGGTLSLLCAVLGTPFDIDYQDAILFIEEVGEEPHRIDRMLTQLLQTGKLNQVRGIVISECAGCESAPYRPAFPNGNFSIEEIFADRLIPLGIPIIYGLALGHGKYKATLPVGVQVTLDGNKGQLIINEPGVK